MAGYIDYVVHAPENSEVAIRRLYRAVTGKVRPVSPVLALGILVVFAVILRHKAVTVAIDGLEHSRPRISDADVPCLARTAFYFFAFFVKDHRIDTRQSRAGAARFHGIDGWFGAAEEAACLCLPPCIDDYGFALAHNFVIPLPHFRLDWFAHGRHMLEVVIVFCRLVGAGFAQHADSCW